MLKTPFRSTLLLIFLVAWAPGSSMAQEASDADDLNPMDTALEAKAQKDTEDGAREDAPEEVDPPETDEVESAEETDASEETNASEDTDQTEEPAPAAFSTEQLTALAVQK